MKNGVCKNCDKRHIGCHGECPDYQEWLEQHIAEKKANSAEQLSLNSMYNYGGMRKRK